MVKLMVEYENLNIMEIVLSIYRSTTFDIFV